MNRRSFLKCSAAVPAPLILPGGVLAKPGRPGANDRIRLGFIGVGNRSRWLMSYFGKEVRGAEVVAVADCYLPRCYGRDARNTSSTPFPEESARWAKYQSYQRMIEKEKLDAVFLGTTTHIRALAAIHAMQAGLDVYSEKPITLTIAEGRALVNAARKYKRVFQGGTQQRSIPINRYASELVRSGKLGKVRFATVGNYLSPSTWTPQPEQPVPDGMDWDAWCNQAELRPYHDVLFRHWSQWADYSGGGPYGVTNWGPHALDQVQCALGTDHTGPVEIWTEDRRIADEPDFPYAVRPDWYRGEPAWEKVIRRKPVVMRFANGTLVKVAEPGKKVRSQFGAAFIGDAGKIQIVRGDYSADPPELRMGAPEPTREGKGEDTFHLNDFLDCMRTRKRPHADIESAHRAMTLCHLVNICRSLQRKLRWDPETESFTGDEEANTQLSRPRRRGYELPRI